MELTFNHGWPAGLVAIVLALAVVYPILLYRREGKIRRPLRIALGVLRAAALALVVILLLEPTAGIEEEVTPRRNVLVLADVSESMGIRDVRKTDPDILEAALALGEVPFDTAPERQLLHRALRAMVRAREALGRGLTHEATTAQRDAVEALRRAVEPTRNGRPLDAQRADEIREEQQELLRELERSIGGASEPGRAAQAQGDIIAELRGLIRQPSAHPQTFSREIRERLAQVPRIDLVKGIAGHPRRSFLDRLGEDYTVHYCTFGEGLESIRTGPALTSEMCGNLKASDGATRLGSAVDEAVRLHGGEPISGVVILTDGISNAGEHALDVAARMGARSVPIYPVGIGVATPDDVSLHDLVVQDVVFSGDTVPARLQIRSHGYEKRQAYLTLTLDERRLCRKLVVLTGEPQFEDVSFDVPGGSRGTAKLEVTVTPFEDEATHENNRARKTLRVVNEKIDVLCIEGSARWEYRYLRAILKRDPRLNVRFIATRAKSELARVSKEYLSRFPDDPEEAFGYDLVIVGDVKASFFNTDELLRLEELVRDRGGSLLMLAGRHYSPVTYADTPVARLLPVEFERDGQSEKLEKGAHPVVTPEGRRSMVMVLDTPREKNDAIWSRLKPLGWVPPVTDVKPGATVLAKLSDAGRQVTEYPLIAWQRYGSGKVMFIATDRLWRLRFKTGDKYHWRLWSQAIHFLTLSRLLGEHKRIKIETDRMMYPRGEPVKIYAHVSNDAYEPAVLPAFDVYVRRVGDDASEPDHARLKPEPGAEGLYGAYYTPPGEGHYRIKPQPEDVPISNVSEFHVNAVRRELAETAMQAGTLRKMAELSGGRYLQVRDLPALPELLRDDAKRAQTMKREVTLWDRWWAAVALLLLAGTEWFLRRKYDLV